MNAAATPATPASWTLRSFLGTAALTLGAILAATLGVPLAGAGQGAAAATPQTAPHDLVVRVLDGGRDHRAERADRDDRPDRPDRTDRTDRTERTVTRAQVTLSRVGEAAMAEPPTLERFTGTDGRAAFENLPAGTYRLTVEAPGFHLVEREVRIPGEIGPSGGILEVILAPRPLTLDEVIATASPLRSGVTYTAAQSFDREELRRRLDASIGTMLDGEPGVAMRSLGPAPTRPVIRGFDGDRILVLENGERMGDIGESSADHAVALDPLSVERLEIVRGPASLLYGSGALGGVVNMTTRDLPRSWSRGLEGGAMLQGASMNRSGAGSAALFWGADDWASTFRISARETGDLETPEGRIGDTALSSLDGSLGLVRAWDEMHVGVSGSLVDRRYGIPEAWDDPGAEVFLTMEQRSLQARVGWEPGEGGAQAGGLRGFELRTRVSTFFQQEIERGLEAGRIVNETVGLEYDAVSASGTATLRHGPVGVVGEGAVGLALRLRQMDIGGVDAFFPGVDERSVALFTFQEAPLTADLNLQVGGRIEANRSKARPSARFPSVDELRTGTALSGSVGLNWRPGGGWEMGAQVARAHRVPLAEELFANGAHLAAGVFEIGSAALSDEVSHGVDVFVRRDFARGSVEAAGFANLIRGYVAFQPLGRIDEASGFPVFQYQGTDARMLGGEFTAHLRLNEVWRMSAGVDWVQGTRVGGDADALPSIPPLRSRLQVHAEPGRWWAGATLRAVSSQARVAPDELATDGYVVFDVQAGMRFDPVGRHALLIRIDNALDTRYRDHLSRLPERDMLMPGRNLTLTWRWALH
jgi:iron complex outermembrane recepter protein